MITQIEQAIVTRLSEGLNTRKGGMVRNVTTYGGELEDIGQILRVLPGIWVTFKGVTSCRPQNTTQRRWRVTGEFAVFVASRSVRSETAQREGGPVPDEPGCNLIAESVRRLLTGQDVGLPIACLRPGRVTNLFRKAYKDSAVSVYVCEFSTHWYEDALDNGRWPAPEDATDPDYIFAEYCGRLDKPWPAHDTTAGTFTTPSGATLDSIVTTEKDE
ncbi:hypothetical protein NG99_04600 [Erwinia typographi]|uniref:Mu-like prophage FluMu protein gp37 n=1 Tax=Erwinia typographi TaxID=371042 RepID=A0A0A4ABV7_9GAMM|nr:DUF1834 family protein [Erwinia typographi]KGT95303.1 hypothetical protein NG99_04600 [Erwinia typographi]